MFTRLLTIFIALFWAVTATAQSSYQIQPGDSLSVEVLEDPALNRNVLVLPDGSFSFPLIGRIETSGRTTDQVQSALAAALAPNFASAPSVFVSVAGLSLTSTLSNKKQIDIYVLGEVNTPGKVQVDTGTTLLQFLAESGGFTRFAATKRVQLRRSSKSGERVVVFNYNAVESGASIPRRTVLRDGDVIVVPQRRLFE
jgi:polysaccharide export outer membrane protein